MQGHLGLAADAACSAACSEPASFADQATSPSPQASIGHHGAELDDAARAEIERHCTLMRAHGDLASRTR
ncbi:MAG: hypothetical protein AAF628_23125 [Planctomycetota bacterium]